VNVLVEVASDRELRGLRELRELAHSANQKVQWYTRCTTLLMIQWAHNLRRLWPGKREGVARALVKG
jgi:hypothetical protein